VADKATMGGLDELAAKLANADEAFNAALATLTDTRKMSPDEIMAASDAMQKARTERDRAKSAYDRAKFDTDNAERLQASVALAEYLKGNILTIEPVAVAHELGVPGFTVRFVKNEDGSVTVQVDVMGAKAPGSPTRKASGGNGTGGSKPRQFVRNRHTGEELKTRDWLHQYGDDTARALIDKIIANNGKVETKSGALVPIGFQPHLHRMLAKPEVAADWELVRRYGDGREEVNGVQTRAADPVAAE